MKWLRSKSDKDPLHFIRMSSPTIGCGKGVQIAPEFLGYLDWLRSHGRSHTYVNFQDGRTSASKNIAHCSDHIKVLGINDESYRSQILQDLEKKYPETLQIITLSRDNSFYFQKQLFRKQDKFSDFSRAFISELMSKEDNGYYLSSSWWLGGEKALESRLSDLMNALHSYLFNAKDHLSHCDRLAFIEIAYLYIALMAADQSYSVNLTCKDGIDRAGAAHGLAFVAQITHEVSQGADSERIKYLLGYLEGMIYSDALTVKHRALLKSRFDRFLAASRLLVEKLDAPDGADDFWSEFMPFRAVVFDDVGR